VSRRAPSTNEADKTDEADEAAEEARRGEVWSIGRLARRFRLSRTTLLYYDRLGLLRAAGRSRAGYRLYDAAAEARLAAICRYRTVGVSLADIRRILDAKGEPARLLEVRSAALDAEIARCREQQRIIAELLRGAGRVGRSAQLLDKARWIAILRASGLDDDAMHRWHVEFERAAPDGHQAFLESLRLSAPEIARIRRDSRRKEA
jgi:DNA-binding transcriptional MerR regulator